MPNPEAETQTWYRVYLPKVEFAVKAPDSDTASLRTIEYCLRNPGVGVMPPLPVVGVEVEPVDDAEARTRDLHPTDATIPQLLIDRHALKPAPRETPKSLDEAQTQFFDHDKWGRGSYLIDFTTPESIS